MLRHRRSLGARLLSVLTVALLIIAYSAGIAHAHWITSTPTGAALGTGSLDIEVEDPPHDFDFECRVRLFPKQAISFIRFWDGDPPTEVEAARPGAVKIDEDGYELGDGDYWVIPPDARLGVPLEVHIGDDLTIRITDWIDKRGGEYVGFEYEVIGDGVWIEVKAGPHIYRGWITGSGMWPPDDLVFEEGDDSIEMLLCNPDPYVAELTVSNLGSIPAAVYLELSEFVSDPDAACQWFEMRLIGLGTGAVLFEGTLCDLAAGVTEMTDQIDPGEIFTYLIEVSVAPGFPWEDLDGVLAGHDAVATWVQWNGSPPPDLHGWWGSASWEALFEITVATPPPELDGFITAAETEVDTYRTVFPVEPAPAVALHTSESGLVCPVTADTWFEDTFGEPRADGRIHLGIDIPAPQGSPLVSIGSGTVRPTIGTYGGYGLTLTTGVATFSYSHLSAYTATGLNGGWVEAGTILGFVGSTGNALSPHLHLGLLIDGAPLNPYPLAAAACLDIDPPTTLPPITSTTSTTITTQPPTTTTSTSTTTQPPTTTTSTTSTSTTTTTSTSTTTQPPTTTTSTTSTTTTTTTTTTTVPPPEPRPSYVTGHVWHDLDEDGIASHEPGLEEITVLLLDSTGTPISETKTGPGGQYRFGPVAPGTYRVEFHGEKDWYFTEHDETTELAAEIIVEAVEEITEHGKRQFGLTAPFQLDEGAVLSFDAGLAPRDPDQQGNEDANVPRDTDATEQDEPAPVEESSGDGDPDHGGTPDASSPEVPAESGVVQDPSSADPPPAGEASG